MTQTGQLGTDRRSDSSPRLAGRRIVLVTREPEASVGRKGLPALAQARALNGVVCRATREGLKVTPAGGRGCMVRHPFRVPHPFPLFGDSGPRASIAVRSAVPVQPQASVVRSRVTAARRTAVAAWWRPFLSSCAACAYSRRVVQWSRRHLRAAIEFACTRYAVIRTTERPSDAPSGSCRAREDSSRQFSAAAARSGRGRARDSCADSPANSRAASEAIR